MKKYILILVSIIFYSTSSIGQKVEQIIINWPPEYKWKIVNKESDSTHQLVTIIPGKQIVKNAQILGTLAAYSGVKYDSVNQIIDYYKAALDDGSILTVIEKQDTVRYHWVIFKIETPKTPKYPEPESDLYFIIQGDYALYANWVAIKKEVLDPDFIIKWTQVFKTFRIVIE